ncbi:MAG: DNA (cytosine-5-)-methyltransferase [Erysipelotrichaceae bacterium]|nr:DNA (cytosine-5-)-methyltransferase [Erysipelotrichaceae bacterium]
MKKSYRIVELFSGIGSQASALENIGLNIEVAATCEWDMQAFIAYDCIHNGKNISKEVKGLKKEELIDKLKDYSLSYDGKCVASLKSISSLDVEVLRRIYSSLINTNNLVDISRVNGKQIPDNIDVMTYSFPCQDLSNVGAFHGYTKGIDKGSGSRSSLLWEVGRILQEMKKSKKQMPRYLVMENVPSLLSNRHRTNFETWKKDLQKLGYISKHFELNAKDFGIPQNRPRLLMMSVYVGKNKNLKNRIENYFNSTSPKSIIEDYKNSTFYKDIKVKDLLRTNYSVKKYYLEALDCNPNDTVSRRKIWNENPKIIDESGRLTGLGFVRTITTKQDRNPNSGNLYFDSKIKGKSKWRYLTPRECLLFMGFKDKDYEALIKNNIKSRNSTIFPRDKIIRLAGNSIPVKLLEGFFYQIYKIEKITK